MAKGKASTKMTMHDLVKMTGLKQAEIADLCGVSLTAVNQLVLGKAISKRIAAALDQLAGVDPGTALNLAQSAFRARRQSVLDRLAAKGIALVPDAEPEEAPINKD